LTKQEKLVLLRMVRELGGAKDCSGASRSDRKRLPARKKAKASSRSYSGVLYEYRLERSRATRGATQVWVVTPGARRRVFYFAAVISGNGEWGEVPQGISSRTATNTRGKIPGETGAGLEGKVAARRTGKSRQTSPEHSGHSDRLG